MPIDFYYSPGSPGCRLVHLVAAAIDLDLNFKLLDVPGGAHLKPEFLKLNPQHTIPTIVDDGFSLWESRAISRYLVSKYGGESSLYPKDPKARAIVDQRLDFDMGTLYSRFSQYFWPQIMANAPADEALFKKLEEALNLLNTFLEGQEYAAGPELTLADLALTATVSTISVVGDISLEPYPNVAKWFEMIKRTVPKYEEANGKGTEALKGYLGQLKPK